MFWSDLKFRLGFMPSIRVAECTQCRNCSSPKLSECPKCKASFPQNCVIRKFTASDIPEDMVELFVTCPGCRRSLKPETQTCPECGATIEREYARQSLEENVKIAQAYVNAQKIASTNPGVVMTLVLAVGITAYAYFFDLPILGCFLLIPFAMPAGALITIRQWFRWFGSYKSDHEDFVTARRKVDHALRRWLVAVAAEFLLAVLWLAWLMFHKRWST